MGAATLGIAVVAKNEADRIGKLLKTVGFADEVVIIDSGSTDRTLSLCEEMGARVIFNKWPGFTAQKQFAMQQLTSDWILSLDADESIPEPLAREIRSAINHASENLNAFSMPRRSRYLNRWIKHGGWYPDTKVRLVRRGKGRWSGDDLHEQLLVEGNIERLSHPIHHYVYRDIADQIVTINRFSTVAANTRGPKGAWFLLAGLLHAMGKFIECYLWKRGLLDGYPGLIIAINSSWYVFLKHAKAWEMGLSMQQGRQRR